MGRIVWGILVLDSEYLPKKFLPLGFSVSSSFGDDSGDEPSLLTSSRGGMERTRRTDPVVVLSPCLDLGEATRSVNEGVTMPTADAFCFSGLEGKSNEGGTMVSFEILEFFLVRFLGLSSII